MAEVVSFAEETCWSGEDFRHVRKKVGFRIYSIGRHLGDKIDAEFIADYGLWWDQNDEILLFHLNEVAPTVHWRDKVYHKKMDMSGIDIYDPDSDMLVARVEVRAYEGRRLDAVDDSLGGNVISFKDAGAKIKKGKDLSTGQNPSGDACGGIEVAQRDSWDSHDT